MRIRGKFEIENRNRWQKKTNTSLAYSGMSLVNLQYHAFVSYRFVYGICICIVAHSLFGGNAVHAE
jgi:hypothetical protein